MHFTFAVRIVQLKVYMNIANPMTLTFIQGHKSVSNVLTFKLQYLRQYLSCYIRTWHAGRLIDALLAHAPFDDLDLDAWTELVGKCEKISSACSR